MSSRDLHDWNRVCPGNQDVLNPRQGVEWARGKIERGGKPPVDSNDTAPGLEMGPGKVCASFDCDYDDHHPMHRMMFLERSKVWACVDCGHVARPSPSDHITGATP